MCVLWHRCRARAAKCRPCAAASERWRPLWRQRSDSVHALQYGQRSPFARAVLDGNTGRATELLRIRTVFMAQTHASRSGGARASRVQWGASGSRGGTPEGARLLLTLVELQRAPAMAPFVLSATTSHMRANNCINARGGYAPRR